MFNRLLNAIHHVLVEDNKQLNAAQKLASTAEPGKGKKEKSGGLFRRRKKERKKKQKINGEVTDVTASLTSVTDVDQANCKNVSLRTNNFL